MRYVPLGDTFSFKFTTRDFDTGAPQTLGGTPVISAYENGSLTEITAGITLTVDFDSRTGLNDVSVVATGANGYEEGKYYAFTITTGTVDTVSVVGEVVHEIVVGPVDANVEQWEGDAGSVKRGITSNLPQVDVDGWQGVPIAGSANMIEDVGGPRWTAPALSQAPGSVGGTLSGHWRWSTDTTATDPGSGFVKGNNATLGSITALFINQIADDGFNFAGAIEDLGLGDTVTVARDNQGGNFILGTVQSAPVDNGDWYTITVVVTDSGGSLGNNNAVNVSFHYQQASAAEIADAVWDESLAAHTSTGSTGEALASPVIDGTPSMNDQKKGETTRLWFTTKNKVGDLVAPTVNGSIYVLEADGITQITAGVTATYNVSQNGEHRVDIDTTNDEYEAEKDYTVVADGMTIDGVAGLSRTVGQFTVRASSIDDVFGSGYVDSKWEWDTDTTETDPGLGEVKVNNANYSLADECYINAVDDRNNNAGLVFESLQSGDSLLIARSTDPGGKFILANVTGPAVDNTGWYTIPINVVDTAGTLAAGNVCSVGFRFAPQVQPFDETDAAQVRYRLQMSSGSQEDPGSDAPLQLEVTADTVTNPVTVGTNNDKTGYNVTSGTVDDVTNPVVASSVTAPVTVGTNNDKSGYDITSIGGSTAAGAQFRQNVDNTLQGTASGTPTTTTMISDINITVDDQLNGRVIIFNENTATAALREQATDITACTASTNTLTFTALTTAPAAGDTFIIV